MTKYFMKGSDEELNFGDWLELDFTKEDNGKKKFHHLECEFCPDLVDMLLENSIITSKEEIKPKKNPTNIWDGVTIAGLYDNYYMLEDKVENMVEDIKSLKKAVVMLLSKTREEEKKHKK